jgi:hypothetical protein
VLAIARSWRFESSSGHHFPSNFANLAHIARGKVCFLRAVSNHPEGT